MPFNRPSIGRLAPSPTGGLHLGHARTFLLAWLATRSVGGRVVLRIEDLDATRTRPEAVGGAIDDLRWLGLDWDGLHSIQSASLDDYQQTLDRLIAIDAVYPCTCTRADIARAASAPHESDEGPAYPGTCAYRHADDTSSLDDRPFAWRFRVPKGLIAWQDRVRGPMELDPSRLGGDFVVARSSGSISYQLAVVHDDAAQNVTQVVRGDDLIPSTPRQILLYQDLGWPIPEFAHVPLVEDGQGRRLAKRDGSLKLATLRETGVDPRRLVGVLAHSCGWAERVVDSSPSDWLGRFDLGRLPKHPWSLSSKDLRSISGIDDPSDSSTPKPVPDQATDDDVGIFPGSATEEPYRASGVADEGAEQPRELNPDEGVDDQPAAEQ